MSFLDSADDDPKRANRRPLLFFVLITLAVGASASVFTEPNIAGWYAGLVHPSFAPPNWVFAPVWTTLYVVMAVAAWRVWRLRSASPARGALAGEVPEAGSALARVASERRRGAIEMGVYALQLIFNFAWSAIFFGAHRIGLALIELCILLALILATTILFWRRDRLAGWLFLPYLAWTSFATALNYAFWSLNP
ncbi:MAG: tryptophan-rich sensory protein [Alphaproteobacteria bacterium]|nr:tryptophan-rich sensory protein [Alphaproteobacteria bacterium]